LSSQMAGASEPDNTINIYYGDSTVCRPFSLAVSPESLAILRQLQTKLKLSGAARLCMPDANPIEVGAAVSLRTEQLVHNAGFGVVHGDVGDHGVGGVARAAAHDFDYNDGGEDDEITTAQMCDEEDFEQAQGPMDASLVASQSTAHASAASGPPPCQQCKSKAGVITGGSCADSIFHYCIYLCEDCDQKLHGVD
jgi:hypothetical protein